MNLAHARAAIAVHEIVPGGQCGAALDMAPYYPHTCDPKDILAAKNASNFKNYFYMDAYIRGEYTESVLAYLKRQGLMFDIQPGGHQLLSERLRQGTYPGRRTPLQAEQQDRQGRPCGVRSAARSV